ncbi:MAG: exopolyphosphatase [Nocardioidaceae bacterium]
MTRVAAVDCGTNSIRLLLCDLDPGDAAQRDIERRMEIVRLGEGVDETGTLAPEALRRTFAVCDTFAAIIRAGGAEAVRFCATSAARDARNAGEFAAGVRERFGVDPEVLTGAEEAALSYHGAMRDLPGLAAPTLVVDIGGGSTELILGDGLATVPAYARSVDIGSVRLTERYLRSDPPDSDEVEAARDDAARAIDGAALDWTSVRSVVGVAGTVTTVAAHALGLSGYDSARIHHARLPIHVVRSSCAELLAATVAQRTAMPFMHPGRADVIGGGALVLEVVLGRVVDAGGRSDLVVSEHDVLDGIAWSVA